MRALRNLRLSAAALAAHRGRSLLAAASTAVGVAGVLVLTAIGEGAKGRVVAQIESLGRNTIVVSAAEVPGRAGRARRGDARMRALRESDAAAVLRATSSVVRAAPAQLREMTARAGRTRAPVTVLGTVPAWREIRDFPLVAGRFFTEDEHAARAPVAVLGARAAESLFGAAPAVGRLVRVAGVPLRVVGVLAPKGVSADGSGTEDDRVVVPLATAQRRLFAVTHVSVLFLEAAPGRRDEARREAGTVLRARHPPRAGREVFTLLDPQVVLATELAARTAFARLLAALGALALLVGGVGTLAVMTLAVRERRGEIGLRMAVGARRVEVLAQFVGEAAMLSLAGGVAGLALGLGVARLVSLATASAARPTPGAAGIALGAALLVGVAFGAHPAWRAASLDPIEALRAE